MPLGSKGVVIFIMVLGTMVFVPRVWGQGIALSDDFESRSLSSNWTTEKLPDNALRYITAPTRTGQGAIEISVFPNAMAEVGADGQLSDRRLQGAAGVRGR